MTVEYALTRAEIVRAFFHSLGSSSKFRALILFNSAAIGVLFLVFSGALSRPLRLRDAVTAAAWAVGAFAFMLLWLFIRGKTAKRTLTVSPEGISTEIGQRSGSAPWSKVKLVANTSQYVLIASVSGNSFLIPNRAFSGPDLRAQFLAEIDRWMRAAS